jgi:hypothetical protein
MTLLAILFPFLSFLFRAKFVYALAALILQATIIGWVLAAIWAFKSLREAQWEKRRERILWEVQHSPMNVYTS